MAGPWEKYAQPQQEGPWARFAQPVAPDPAAVDPEPQAEQPGVLEDVAKSAGVGALRGLAQTAAVVPDVLSAAGDVGASLLERFGSRFLDGASPEMQQRFASAVGRVRGGPPMVGSQDTVGALEAVAGPLYEPQTNAGEYAE